MQREQRTADFKALIEKSGLDSQQLHTITGHHPTVIRQWKNGHKPVTARTLRYFRLSLAEHFERKKRQAVTA